MLDWLTTGVDMASQLIAPIFGRLLKGWLQRGLARMEVQVIDFSFALIQTDNPFIEAKIQFRNRSSLVIEIDRLVNATAKLASGVPESGNAVLLLMASELDLLHLRPHDDGEDTLRIFMPAIVAQRILKHVDAGQEEKWQLDFKWRARVNGQILPCQRKIDYKTVPKVLVL